MYFQNLGVYEQKRPFKIASHPYPLLFEENSILPKVEIQDIYLKTILKIWDNGSEASTHNTVPLDITLKDIVRSFNVNNNEVYQHDINVLDITRKDIVRSFNLDNREAYQHNINVLDIVMIEIVHITHNQNGNESIIPALKPLDITLI